MAAGLTATVPVEPSYQPKCSRQRRPAKRLFDQLERFWKGRQKNARPNEIERAQDEDLCFPKRKSSPGSQRADSLAVQPIIVRQRQKRDSWPLVGDRRDESRFCMIARRARRAWRICISRAVHLKAAPGRLFPGGMFAWNNFDVRS